MVASRRPKRSSFDLFFFGCFPTTRMSLRVTQPTRTYTHTHTHTLTRSAFLRSQPSKSPPGNPSCPLWRGSSCFLFSATKEPVDPKGSCDHGDPPLPCRRISDKNGFPGEFQHRNKSTATVLRSTSTTVGKKNKGEKVTTPRPIIVIRYANYSSWWT